MLTHLIAVVLIHLTLQQTPARTGSVNVLVVDSAAGEPITAADVSISRVEEKWNRHGLSSTATEVKTKIVDSHGVATFVDILPGKYLLSAITEKGDENRTHIGASRFVLVQADSVSSVRITVNPSSVIPFDSSPNFRMNIVKPDTNSLEKMPIYNPERHRRAIPDASRRLDH